MNKKIILVTTTSSIDGYTIEQYYGIVTYQLIVGANIFKDIFASFRDIVGGQSIAYQDELIKMEEIVIDNLKNKALKFGANVILGLRLDYDEISGGGKSMFMLTATGTAAYGKLNSENAKSLNNKLNKKIISHEDLIYVIIRENLIKKINIDTYSIKDLNEIELLIKYNIESIENVIKFVNSKDYDKVNVNVDEKQLIRYFKSVSNEAISEFLQNNYFLTIKNRTFKIINNVLSEINWYDYNTIYYLLSSSNPIAHNRALNFIDTLNSKFYTESDINFINGIIKLLNTTFEKYPILKIKKGTFGKDFKIWECINCGNENSENLTECKSCNANIYGFERNLVIPDNLISNLQGRINKLKQLLVLN